MAAAVLLWPSLAALAGSGYQSRPEFTIIALPDTQLYSQDYPATFTAQTRWIVNHKTDLNIAFVSHLGDIVQEGDQAWQWARASASMSVLDSDPSLPYGLCVGNHDSYPRGTPDGTANFNLYFPVTRYTGRSWYGGHYGSDNDNSYQLFTASGMDFVVVHLEYDELSNAEVLAWADGILKTHASRRAIVSSHNLLSKTDPGEFSDRGQMVYDYLKGNPNLFLMLCGHCSGLQAGRRSDVFNGNTVWTLLADFQDRPNGGDGWLRILRFRPDYDDIRATTYSVTLDMFEDDDKGQFSIPYDMGGLHTVPPDLDHDGDVDMEDYGVLQRCFTSPYESVSMACILADFNNDDQVNQADFDVFFDCLAGPDMPIDLDCVGS